MKYLGMRIAIPFLAAVAMIGCSSSRSGDSGAYTLYRTSVVSGINRVHVATFDAKDGGAYNRENCELAAGFFSGQPSIETRFWCESGFFSQEP
jgi:hypothetical protein